MHWTAFVSNMFGFGGAFLLAFSVVVIMPFKRGDEEGREVLRELLKKKDHTLLVGMLKKPFVYVRKWRFRIGLGLIGISYLLPFLALVCKPVS